MTNDPNDPKNPEYNAKARDAIMDLCPFYDPNHKGGIVREHVFRECLTELRERNRLLEEKLVEMQMGEMESHFEESVKLRQASEAVNPDSDTPESDAMWIHCVRNSGPMSGIRMHLKMQELERARDLARRGIDCAINGIRLMGEVPYDCRAERDHHAKKIIERLEGYLISPLNAQCPSTGEKGKAND